MFNGKMKAFTLSFDDGVTQDIRFIELLNKYNLKCTFNLNSELLGCFGYVRVNDRSICHQKVRSEDVRHIYDGHEIAVHTLTHPLLPKIEDDNEIIRQVEEDRLNLSELAGYEVVGMAYPGGGKNNDDRVAGLIKNNTGVRYARTIKADLNFDLQNNLYRYSPTLHMVRSWKNTMDVAQEFIELKADKPQIFYVWGHTYEFDGDSTYWDRVEEFFKLISGKDDIFYGTNKEILL